MANQNGKRRRAAALAAGAAVLLLALAVAGQNFFWLGPATMPLPMDQGAQGAWQAIQELGTIASALHTVAHPDDEDGGMLAYEARGQGVRMGLLTLTRGEGGQNVMTGDYFDAAGLLRTREVLNADRFYGVRDQMFARVVDFGYTRSLPETARKWKPGHPLASVVRAIREFRPMVVLSRFQGNPADGHGNHQMSGVLSRQAFLAAADPRQFPQQIRQGLRPWAAQRLYEDNIRANQAWNVAVPEGQYDPVLGATFLQIARHGWWQHLSQYGGGAIPHPGAFHSYYRLLATARGGFLSAPSPEHQAGFFAGLDTRLTALAAWAHPAPDYLLPDLAHIAAQVAAARAAFRLTAPQRSVPALAEGLALTRALDARLRPADHRPGIANIRFELAVKERQFQRGIADALGAQLLATVAPRHRPRGFFARFSWPDTPRFVTRGQRFGVIARITAPEANRCGDGEESCRVTVQSMVLEGPAGGEGKPAAPGAAGLGGTAVSRWVFAARTPAQAAFTEPYWRPRASVEQSWYDLRNPADARQDALRPFAPYPYHVRATLLVNGVPVTIRRLVLTSQHLRGLGQQLWPLMIAPRISVALSPRVGVMPIRHGQGAPGHERGPTHPFALVATVRSQMEGAAAGSLRLQLPAGWSSQPAEASFALDRPGQAQSVRFMVTPGVVRERSYAVRACAQLAGAAPRCNGFRLVGYPGIRPYPFYQPADYRTTGVRVKVASGIRLGYLMGTGDAVPSALTTLGVPVHLLTAGELAYGNLNQYTEIMLGIRAYAARPDLRRYNQRLLAYVRQGGVLVVQYNNQAMNHDYGPYPYVISHGVRVTQEHQPVTILRPQAPLLNDPNHITEADFQGWVEERGHGFWDSWSPQYTPLLAVHDRGQAPQLGGLLVAHYGRGLYVYIAYALYRQLPQGVPGAFRILANLASARP